VPPFNEMYICEVCNQTYHWMYLKSTGYCTERQRKELDKNDDWACPGLTSMMNKNKKDTLNP